MPITSTNPVTLVDESSLPATVYLDDVSVVVIEADRESVVIADGSGDVLFVSEGEQGPRGVPGDIGTKGDKGDTGDAGPGAGPVQSLIALAGIALGGHRVVGPDHAGNYVYVDYNTALNALRATGITTGAASSGAAVTVQTSGPMTEPSWAWSADQPIYLGVNGLLTQTPPTKAAGADFILPVGVALTATSMFIRFQAPIIL